MFIATLIADDRLVRGDLSAAADALAAAGLDAVQAGWVDQGSAFDFRFDAGPERARAALEGLLPRVDVVVQRETGRRKRMLVADMDSTMIAVECIDELADYAGLKAEVAAVTDQAMRGELDFEAALDARVALLKGLDAGAIERCRAERVRLTPGARELVATMRAHGAFCLLVSGGFTRFADPVAAEIGFDCALANELLIEDGRLTGAVARPIVGAEAKRQALRAAAAERGLSAQEALGVGDGANDIPMLQAAGLGVAFRAKPATAAAAAARIEHNGLTALLWAQGYARSDWVA